MSLVSRSTLIAIVLSSLLFNFSALAQSRATDHQATKPAVSTRAISAEEMQALLKRDGTRPLLVNYWATWCDPCREEMPSMQRLQDKLAGKPFAILAVDYGEGAPRINDFLKKVPVRFTVLLDRDTSVASAWQTRPR